MLSDIVSYYEHNVPMMPFVSAPISGHQDTLIIAHQDIAKHDKYFLNQLFDTISVKKIQSICIRVFNYNHHIVIAIIFPTSVKEDETGRSGLVFSIGIMIGKKNINLLNNSTCLYFNTFISLINKIFEVNILEHGADEILIKIKEFDNNVSLSKQFLLLKNILVEISNFFVVSDNIISWQKRKIMDFFSKKDIFSLPKVIIYNKKMSKIEIIIEHVLSNIERYIKRYRLNQSITKETGEALNQSISFIKMDIQSFDINKIECKNRRDHSIISIY